MHSVTKLPVIKFSVAKLAITLSLLLNLVGCATNPYNYTALQESSPRSILVLPPTSDAIDINAGYTFISTITKPLAEKGYYVFPVAVVDTFLKENGVTDAQTMHSISLDKFSENIGADSILYVHINDWGQKYQVLSSVTVVDANVRLVDGRTGTLLWDKRISLSRGSSDGGGGLAGMLVGALVNQIVGSKIDLTHSLSAEASTSAINNKSNGLLPGPYSIHSQSKN